MPPYSPSVVFITGASAGIGAACARRFAREGSAVIVTGRRLDRLQALAAELGPRAHPLVLDVGDRAAVAAAVAALPPALAAVDLLVNNAGLAMGLEPADRADLDDWEQMVKTNINGALHCIHALLPGMVARHRGHIINLGSVAGTYPYPGGNVYGATKAFLEQLSLNLRADLLGKDVRVTSIEPGMVQTEFSVVRFGGDADKASAVYRGMQPLDADDIADVIHYAATRPPHVNINRLEVMPTAQAFAPFAVHRKP